MTTTRRFFSGDTLEQAVMQAARHHHLLPDQVAYKVIEKRHGFLKIRRGIVISVDPESPEKTVEEEAPAPAAEPRVPVETVQPERSHEPEPVVRERAERRPPAADRDAREVAPWHLSDELDEPSEPEVEPEPEPEPEPEVESMESAAEDPSPESELDDEEAYDLDEEDEEDEEPASGASDDEREESFELGEDMADGAREAVEVLLEFADVEGMSMEIGEGEDRLEVRLSGDGQDRLLEDRGALLLAVEHLVPRLLRGILGRSAPVRVDCGGFHEARERRLEDLALDTAAEARRRQRPRTLAPMSPEERRIVHLTLADDPDVRTESQGRGFFKRVTVSPVRHRSRVYD